jgi:isopentenyl-diphosphate delta-isomerase
MKDHVILVSPEDNPVGYMEKIEAHQKGLLHRAISVFIFNERKEMLIQRRALSKYHTPGIWSNTACSHPRKNETTMEAAERRLFEEMGMKTTLNYGFKFLYKAEFNNGLIEHELDHVFFGFSNDKPSLNNSEVCDYKYLDIGNLEKMILQKPETFSPWFKLTYKKVFDLADCIVKN